MVLADMGAEVIKVDSCQAQFMDTTRLLNGPYPNNDPGENYWDRAGTFQTLNRGKRSVTLDLRSDAALDILRQLVSVSDIVLENFRPGVMDRLGLGYPQLKEVKPDIILVSLSSNGQTGPESRYAGYAPMFAAIGGLGHLTGYPDAPPVELRHAMDHTGGMMAAFGAVAALCAKSAYDLGQHVDVSVRDIATSFIGTALLDYAMNRREHFRKGNQDEVMSPHGVYRCQGEDNWVSIAVGSQAEWLGLLRALDQPAWVTEEKFGDAYLRWQNRDALDQHLEEWTTRFTPQEVTDLLQREGVAAFPSLAADQLLSDHHLQARQAFPWVKHPQKGRQRAVAPPWRFSETPAQVDRWTPDLGEHNLEVFHRLLGLTAGEVELLSRAQVIW